jgi:hypothetical protein
MDRREEERRHRQEQERREREQRRREETERSRKQQAEQQRKIRQEQEQEQERQRKQRQQLERQQRMKQQQAAARQPGEKGALTRFVFGALKTVTGRGTAPGERSRTTERKRSIFRVIGGGGRRRELSPEQAETFEQMEKAAAARKAELQAAASRRIEGYGIELDTPFAPHADTRDGPRS